MAFGFEGPTPAQNQPPILFVPSPGPSVGVEVEMQIIDPVTLDMAPKYGVLTDALPEDLKPYCKYELFQAIIEMVTPKCESVYQVAHEFSWMFEKIHKVADGLDLALMGCGTHPFADWRQQPISNDARYQRLLGVMGWPARRMLITGTHVHVGVDSGEKAVAIMNSLCCYVPHLMALSASSPYWSGTDTQLASSRLKIFELLPTAGLPPAVTNWTELVTLMRTLIAAHAINTIREIWWDVRPHPGFGTIEVRVCDGLASPGEIIALTAFVQMLVVHLGELYDHGEPLPVLKQWTLKENKWRAARYADEASVIRNEKGNEIPVREHMAVILEELKPTAARLGTSEFIPWIERVLEIGPSFRRQREFMKRVDCHRRLVRSLVDEFRTDSPLDGLLEKTAAKYRASKAALEPVKVG